MILLKDLVIGIKGAGEMATGIACRLFRANIKQIFMMEIQCPKAVRRTVSFCEAIYNGSAIVEKIASRKVLKPDEIPRIWQDSEIPVITDPLWNSVGAVKPHVMIDAIIAKANLGTRKSDAPLVIGIGPGFTAGNDVDIVIETNRGHDLGRVIKNGPPAPDTGVPGIIGGKSKERVLRSPCPGTFFTHLEIGTSVKKNDVVGYVADQPVLAQIGGVIRGLIRNQTKVTTHLKIGDIDPRGNKSYCKTISEKSRAIGGAVLEVVLNKYNT